MFDKNERFRTGYDERVLAAGRNLFQWVLFFRKRRTECQSALVIPRHPRNLPDPSAGIMNVDEKTAGNLAFTASEFRDWLTARSMRRPPVVRILHPNQRENIRL
jgi:hypothetical protein